MTLKNNSLFDAYHADHAMLGRGFHDLSQALRSNDLASARRVAERIDAEAGAHIAFEEEHFYRALLSLLGKDEVEKMYQDHDAGLEAVQKLMQASALEERQRDDLLRKSEAMETHIAECGDLFSAIGRIGVEEQHSLYRQLLEWRERHPRWTEFAATRKD